MKELKLSFPYPATSKHNLSQDVATSMGFSLLTPIRCVEVLPGDSHRIRTSFSLLSNPLVKPLLQGVRLRYCRFWIPRRIYHLDQRANNTGFEPHDISYRYGQFGLFNTADQPGVENNAQFQASSMFDYFRLAVGNDFIYESNFLGTRKSYLPMRQNSDPLGTYWEFNAEPFIGYYDICRTYFADSATGTIAFNVQQNLAGLQPGPDGDKNKNSGALIYPLVYLDSYIDSIQNQEDTYVGAPQFYRNFGKYTGAPASGIGGSNGFSPFFLVSETPFQGADVTVPTSSWQQMRVSHHGLCIPSNRADRLSRLFNTEPLTSQNATIASNEVSVGNMSFLSKMQRYLTRRFFGGSRFKDVMYSVYGQNVPCVDSPVCLDVFDYELGSELVASTNATSDQNPGVIGGYFQGSGVLSTRNGRETRRYRFNEAGYIIDLCYIMPRLFRETFTPDYFFVDAVMDHVTVDGVVQTVKRAHPTQGAWVPDFNGIGWQQPAFTKQFRYTGLNPDGSGYYMRVVPGFASEGSWQQYRTLPDVSSGLMNSTNGVPTLSDTYDNGETSYERIVPDVNSPIMVFGDHRNRPNYIRMPTNESTSTVNLLYFPIYNLARLMYCNPVDYYAVFGVSNIDYDPFFVVFNYAHQAKRQVTKRFTLTFA